MRYLTSLCLLFYLLGIRPNTLSLVPEFKSVKVDTLLAGDFSSRALLIDGPRVWYAADKSRYGYYHTETKAYFESKFKNDTLDLRSIAATPDKIFALNAGSPAFLYSIDKKTNSQKIVYTEHHKKTFYDSMQFWNAKEGIAMGDPVDDCFSVIITRDGGASWKKLQCKSLPKVEMGEAAFAASNSNIAIKGNKAWIVSGGKKARVFYSADKGQTWKVFDTPIVSGKEMTGIFSADFYDENVGFIAGGDYERQNRNQENKAITRDGGKTWKLVAENEAFGYASCIQFVPKSKGNGIVTVGASGLYYSNDAGNTWKQLLKDYSLSTIRFSNDSTAYAAGKGKIVRINFESKP